MDQTTKRLLWITAVGIWLNIVAVVFGLSFDTRNINRVWYAAASAASAASTCEAIADGTCANGKLC
jgi:hypothetical protein